MNLASAIPRVLWGAIVFTDKIGATTAGQATARPVPGGQGDGFKADVTIRERHRELMVRPAGLAFLPKSGMTATWEGAEWNVLGSVPLDPAGTGEAVMLKVVLAR